MTKLKEKQIRDKFLKYNMRVLKKRIKECTLYDLMGMRVGVIDADEYMKDKDNAYCSGTNDNTTKFGKLCDILENELLKNKPYNK